MTSILTSFTRDEQGQDLTDVSISNPSVRCRLTRLVAAFVCDDCGSDLLEYALLTALVGLTGFLAFSQVSTKMSTAYTGWNNAADSRWIPPAPTVP
jgi:Flp pilus assembly pilin Flp